MRVRITVRYGYADRFGVFHEYGATADLPDAIAAKLIARGIAVESGEPEPKRSPVHVVTSMVEPPANAAPLTTNRPPGRPGKKGDS